MTTEPKNELPDEIYYRTDGTFWLQKPDDSAIVYTRPAKGVQGDIQGVEVRRLKNALKTANAALEMIGFDPHGHCFICGGIESCDHTLKERVDAFKTKVESFVSPSLTPESEGMAKK